MIYILRIFFYSFGLATVFSAFVLDPATALFSDLLGVLHTAVFWQLIGMVAFTIWGADLVLSGTARRSVDVVFTAVSNLAGDGAGKSEH